MGGLPNALILIPTYPKQRGPKSASRDWAHHVGVVERSDHHCGDDLVFIDFNVVSHCFLRILLINHQGAYEPPYIGRPYSSYYQVPTGMAVIPQKIGARRHARDSP